MPTCPYCRKAVPTDARQCPHCFEDLRNPVSPAHANPATILDAPIKAESGKDEHRGHHRVVTRQEEAVSASAPAGPPTGAPERVVTRQEVVATRKEDPQQASKSEGVLTFRPVLRPPLARVCVLDDGESDGEWHRIRSDKCLIGRTDGQIVVAHDVGISGRHAEICRRVVNGQFRWFLRDLESTNGIFVKVTEGMLSHGREFLIGCRRYQYRGPVQRAAMLQEEEGSSKRNSTQPMQAVSPADLLSSKAMLVEITPDGEGKSFTLSADEDWVGADPNDCSVVIYNDPMCSPRHARIWFDGRGDCHIQDAESFNGLWLRIEDETELEAGETDFQLGEQRFKVRISK